MKGPALIQGGWSTAYAVARRRPFLCAVYLGKSHKVYLIRIFFLFFEFLAVAPAVDPGSGSALDGCGLIGVLLLCLMSLFISSFQG